MSITYPVKFGNGDGEVPYEQPTQAIAIQVPLVYDECIQNHCYRDKFLIEYLESVNPTSYEFDNIETSDRLHYAPTAGINGSNYKPKEVLTYKVTNVEIKNLSFTASPKGNNYKNVEIDYKIEFSSYIIEEKINDASADSNDPNERIHKQDFSVDDLKKNLTLYCPSSQINSQCSNTTNPLVKILSDNIVIEIESYSVDITGIANYCFSLCFQLIAKSEFMVQVLVPSYGKYIGKNPCSISKQDNPSDSYLKNIGEPILYPDLDFKIFKPKE